MEILQKILAVLSYPFVKMLIILLVGHVLILCLLKILNKMFSKSKLDPSLIGFLNKAIKIVTYVLLCLSALSTIGVSTTGIVAAMSAAAVGVAVALKDSLNNIAGGILLLISPRFATGDYIAAGGDEGTVLKIDLLHTTLLTGDSRQVSVPNGALLNSHITNYSIENQRRVDINFPIAYEADVELAKATAIEIAKNHPLVIITNQKPPFARIKGYADSSVDLVTRVWCKTADYWTVYFDLTEQIRVAFEEKGIAIPYNQLDVHIKNDNA